MSSGTPDASPYVKGLPARLEVRQDNREGETYA